MINYTIIIPHKNCPHLLQRCVDSIPKRTDIQVVVVDDNSSDDKKPHLNREDVEIVLLNSEQSKGAGRARNVGLNRAKGKWVLFADSDDFFTDHLLDILDKYKGSSSDLILFKANSVDSNTLKMSNRHLGINAKIDRGLKDHESIREIALEIEVPWCKMVRSEFVKHNDIKFDEVLASNDTMFSTKVTCMANNIELSDDVLYVVTTRTGSLWNTRKKPANYLSRISVYVDRCKYLKQHGFSTTPLIMPYISLGYIDILTNCKALCMIVKNRCLFCGWRKYFVKQLAKRIRK